MGTAWTHWKPKRCTSWVGLIVGFAYYNFLRNSSAIKGIRMRRKVINELFPE